MTKDDCDNSKVKPFTISIENTFTIVKFIYPFKIGRVTFLKNIFVTEAKNSNTIYIVPVGYLALIVNPVVRFVDSSLELGYKVRLHNKKKFNNSSYIVPANFLEKATEEEIHKAGLGGWMLHKSLDKINTPLKYKFCSTSYWCDISPYFPLET